MSYREQLNKLVKSDPFWTNNPSILISSGRAVEFVPTSDMSRSEKLNAMSRFSLYLGFLLFIIYSDVIYLSIPLISCALFYFIDKNYPDNPKQLGSGAGTGAGCASNMCGAKSSDYQHPTQENPFMNVLLTDYVNNPKRSPAANIEDVNVRADMEKMFEFGLYKDVDDIWNRNNSQRQYYTNPSTTIPNDRDSFMNWCWNTPYVCKDGDQMACLKNEDVRARGQII